MSSNLQEIAMNREMRYSRWTPQMIGAMTLFTKRRKCIESTPKDGGEVMWASVSAGLLSLQIIQSPCRYLTPCRLTLARRLASRAPQARRRIWISRALNSIRSSLRICLRRQNLNRDRAPGSRNAVTRRVTLWRRRRNRIPIDRWIQASGCQRRKSTHPKSSKINRMTLNRRDKSSRLHPSPSHLFKVSSLSNG